MPEAKPLRPEVARRLELNRRLADRVAANDSAPQPDVLTRRSELAAMTAPSADYKAMSKRLAKRQEKGNPAADNDNTPWPLREQLKREGSEALLNVAERYRIIADAAEASFDLMGSGPSLEAQSLLQSKTFDMLTGKDHRQGIKRIKGAMPVSDGNFQVATRSEPEDEDNFSDAPPPGVTTFKRKPSKRVAKRWNGDEPLLAHIDSKRVIARLRACLGPLIDTFEASVLHGTTFSAIGSEKGGNSASSGSIGRAYVMDGLLLVQDEFRLMDMERRSAA